MTRALSCEVWRGPSPFNGDGIRLILTGLQHPSANGKTGPCVQAWVVRDDGNPSLDVGTDREVAVCGDCPLRGALDERVCHVWKGLVRLGQHIAHYPRTPQHVIAPFLTGRHLRVTAYGEPTFVPYWIWAKLLRNVFAWTGFTHQWRKCDPRYREILMASVHSPAEAREAVTAGWRYFRMADASHVDVQREHEFLCAFAARGVQCIDCGLCAGASQRAKNVVMPVHGPGRAARFRRKFR